jgi:hypothetical protein
MGRDSGKDVPSPREESIVHVSLHPLSDVFFEGSKDFSTLGGSSGLHGQEMSWSGSGTTGGLDTHGNIGGLQLNERAPLRSFAGLPLDVASTTTVNDSLISRRQKITLRRTSLSACSGRTGKILCLAAVMLVLSLVGTSEAGHPRKDRMRGYLDAGTALYEYWEGGAGGKGLTGDDAESFCVGRGGNLVRVDSEDVRQIVAGLTGDEHSKVRFPYRAHSRGRLLQPPLSQCFPGLHSGAAWYTQALVHEEEVSKEGQKHNAGVQIGAPLPRNVLHGHAVRPPARRDRSNTTLSSAGLDRPALERTLMGMERTASGRST